MNSSARGSCWTPLEHDRGNSQKECKDQEHPHRYTSPLPAAGEHLTDGDAPRQLLTTALDVEGDDVAGVETVVPRNQRRAFADRSAVDAQHTIAWADVDSRGRTVRAHVADDHGLAGGGPPDHRAAATTHLDAQRRLCACPHEGDHDPERHRREGQQHERGQQAAMTQHCGGDRVVRHLRQHLDRGGHSRDCTGLAARVRVAPASTCARTSRTVCNVDVALPAVHWTRVILQYDAMAPPRRRRSVSSRSPRLRMAGRVLAGVAATGVLCLGYLAVTVPDVRPLATEPPADTAFMRLRGDQAHAEGRPAPREYRFVPYARIAQTLKRAVLVTEDSGFWDHEGIELERDPRIARSQPGQGRRSSAAARRSRSSSPRTSTSRRPRIHCASCVS